MDDTRYRIRDPRSGATQDIPDGALPFFQNQGWVVVETLGDPPDMALPAVHVVYADDANALRPQTTQPVVWYGAVQPIHLDADNGDKWVQLAAGPPGPSGTITSATVSMLPPGADPTVTLGGTPLARTVAFGIPAATGAVPGRVLNNNGTVNTQKKLTVKLTADGLDIEDLIIEDVA